MKKLFMILAAVCGVVALAAPMASQNWVTKRVDTARLEMDARMDAKLADSMGKIDAALALLGDVSPDLTNDVEYVSRAGTNESFVVATFPANTNLVNVIAAWDKISDRPKLYKNISAGFTIYKYDGFVEMVTNRNTFTSTTTKLVSTPTETVVAITNRVPVTEYQSTPIWEPESYTEQLFPYEGDDGETLYVTNRVVVPAYISGYNTVLVTNSWETQINAYTNFNYSYAVETNKSVVVKEYVNTNTYDKVWAELNGERFDPISKIVYWQLNSPTNGNMTIYKFDCNDVEWYKSVYGGE